MGSRAFLLLGIFVAIILLISSEVAARDLAEASTEEENAKMSTETNGVDHAKNGRYGWQSPPPCSYGRYPPPDGYERYPPPDRYGPGYPPQDGYQPGYPPHDGYQPGYPPPDGYQPGYPPHDGYQPGYPPPDGYQPGYPPPDGYQPGYPPCGCGGYVPPGDK